MSEKFFTDYFRYMSDGMVSVNHEDSEVELKNKVLASEITKKWLKDIEPKRIIIVKGKIINIVF